MIIGFRVFFYTSTTVTNAMRDIALNREKSSQRKKRQTDRQTG